MNLLETPTIQAGGVISNAICALVISFMYYKSSAFNCGRTPSLVGT